MTKLIFIGIWHNRFEYERYLTPDGKLKTFGSYQQAWDYIVTNNLPLGASAAEEYRA